MNPTEQKQRHNAVKSIEVQLLDLQTLLIELGAEVVKDRANVADRFKTLHLDMADLSEALERGPYDQQRRMSLGPRVLMREIELAQSMLSGVFDELRRDLDGLRYRTLWERLRWLLTGR